MPLPFIRPHFLSMQEQNVSGHSPDLEDAGVRLYSTQISGKTMPWLSDSSLAHRLFHDREILDVTKNNKTLSIKLTTVR